MDVGTLVEEVLLEVTLLEELLEDVLLALDELVDTLEIFVVEVIDDVVLVELITLVVDVDEVSTREVDDSTLDEIAGSEEPLEVAFVAGPEQAEINKAKRSDKCFFIIKQPYT